jgi:PAS domain-containing protein
MQDPFPASKDRLVKKNFLVRDQIIRWPDGREVRFEVAADITERKLKEDALRKSERRIRALSRRLTEAQEIEKKYLMICTIALGQS